MKVAIIGAGPVGLFAGYAFGMLGVEKLVLFESLDVIGGQCTMRYPDKFIYDMPAIPKILGRDFIDQLYEQLKGFNHVIHTNTTITKLQTEEESVIVNEQRFDACIVTTGFGAGVPIKFTGDLAAKYEDKQVFYNVREVARFTDERVVILGGGNSAVDWALAISKVAKEVHIVHRRDVFTAFPASVQQLRQCGKEYGGNLYMHNNTTVKRLLEGETHSCVMIEGVELSNGHIITCDSIIVCYGMRSDSSALHGFDLKLNGDKIVVDFATCQTSLKRVYAAGDIAYNPFKTKLFSILAGCNEVAIAAADFGKMIGADGCFCYSSDK